MSRATSQRAPKFGGVRTCGGLLVSGLSTMQTQNPLYNCGTTALKDTSYAWSENGVKMQLDVGSEPTLRIAYVTCINLDFGKVYTLKLLSSLIFGPVHMDGRTESDAYEPTVQNAQVGSKTDFLR